MQTFEIIITNNGDIVCNKIKMKRSHRTMTCPAFVFQSEKMV